MRDFVRANGEDFKSSNLETGKKKTALDPKLKKRNHTNQGGNNEINS